MILIVFYENILILFYTLQDANIGKEIAAIFY